MSAGGFITSLQAYEFNKCNPAQGPSRRNAAGFHKAFGVVVRAASPSVFSGDLDSGQ